MAMTEHHVAVHCCGTHQMECPEEDPPSTFISVSLVPTNAPSRSRNDSTSHAYVSLLEPCDGYCRFSKLYMSACVLLPVARPCFSFHSVKLFRMSSRLPRSSCGYATVSASFQAIKTLMTAPDNVSAISAHEKKSETYSGHLRFPRSLPSACAIHSDPLNLDLRQEVCVAIKIRFAAPRRFSRFPADRYPTTLRGSPRSCAIPC
jgi:hypothetical protein